MKLTTTINKMTKQKTAAYNLNKLIEQQKRTQSSQAIIIAKHKNPFLNIILKSPYYKDANFYISKQKKLTTINQKLTKEEALLQIITTSFFYHDFLSTLESFGCNIHCKKQDFDEISKLSKKLLEKIKSTFHVYQMLGENFKLNLKALATSPEELFSIANNSSSIRTRKKYDLYKRELLIKNIDNLLEQYFENKSTKRWPSIKLISDICNIFYEVNERETRRIINR